MSGHAGSTAATGAAAARERRGGQQRGGDHPAGQYARAPATPWASHSSCDHGSWAGWFDGHGLGLSIVTAVAAAHYGSLKLPTTQAAGVRHWGDDPGFDASQPMDLAERLALIQQAPLLVRDGHGTSDGWVTCDGYGYAQFIGRIAGHAAYLHPGDNPGYQSLAVWLPGQAACVAILVNDEAADIEALLRQLVPVALEG